VIRTVNPQRPSDPDPRDGDDRAQPGDVLGIERDGETTELGDTREDEDERREDAEEAVRTDRDRRSK
jgi:hypothetical protein